MKGSGDDARRGAGAVMCATRLTRRSLLGGTAIGLAALTLGAKQAVSGIDPTEAVLARLCDIVIPDTDTPGALAAGAASFLPFAFVHGLFGGDGSTLSALTRHLDAHAGAGGFLAAEPAAQRAIITALDHATFGREPAPPVPLPAQGTTIQDTTAQVPLDSETQHLWRIVKSAIVTSFYTSESGGSRTLAYELVPGRYDADIPLHKEPYLSNFWIENIF